MWHSNLVLKIHVNVHFKNVIAMRVPIIKYSEVINMCKVILLARDPVRIPSCFGLFLYVQHNITPVIPEGLGRVVLNS